MWRYNIFSDSAWFCRHDGCPCITIWQVLRAVWISHFTVVRGQRQVCFHFFQVGCIEMYLPPSFYWKWSWIEAAGQFWLWWNRKYEIGSRLHNRNEMWELHGPCPTLWHILPNFQTKRSKIEKVLNRVVQVTQKVHSVPPSCSPWSTWCVCIFAPSMA